MNNKTSQVPRIDRELYEKALDRINKYCDELERALDKACEYLEKYDRKGNYLKIGYTKEEWKEELLKDEKTK